MYRHTTVDASDRFQETSGETSGGIQRRRGEEGTEGQGDTEEEVC